MWGVSLACLLFVPSMSLTEGFGFSEVTTPAARYEQLVLGGAGGAAIIGAVRGTPVWGWILVVAIPLLVGLGAWEWTDHVGAWWLAWWRPLWGIVLVGVPAWLLLGRGLPAT